MRQVGPFVVVIVCTLQQSFHIMSLVVKVAFSILYFFSQFSLLPSSLSLFPSLSFSFSSALEAKANFTVQNSHKLRARQQKSQNVKCSKHKN